MHRSGHAGDDGTARARLPRARRHGEGASTLADRQAEKQLVKSRVRLDELARDLGGCDLERRGEDDFWACCPFHVEDTPSFHVRPGMGFFKCFGCGESGDVIAFVQRLRGVSFPEALAFLADRAGVTLGSLSDEERREQARLRRTRGVLESAARLFARALEGHRDDAVRRYLSDRGFDADVLSRFDVGWAPPDFEARLVRGGVRSTDLSEAGFTRAFCGRLTFGIRDGYGTLLGFGARTLDPDGGPKYVNTRETSAFNKRRVLYGLDKAARAIARSRRAIVMEGYTDVMMAHQRGLAEAVATMGTSLTEEHVGTLTGKATNIVLVFDGDSAGQDAAERAVRRVLATGRECRVLSLPGGADPCEWLAEHDADAFERLLAERGEATVPFLCRRGLAALDPGEPGGPERVASEVLEATRTLGDRLRRDRLAAEIARSCRVDRNVVARRAGAVAGSAPSRSGPARSGSRPVSAHVLNEFAAVARLAREPGIAPDLRALAEDGVLAHTGALRLLELAGDPPLDAGDWLARVREEAPALAPTLERFLVPAPGDTLLRQCDDDPIAFLGRAARSRAERREVREELTRDDLAADREALSRIQSRLAARHVRPERPAPDDHQTGALG